MNSVAAAEAAEIGGAEAHGEMGHGVVVASFEHFAVAIEPSERSAVLERYPKMDVLAVAVDAPVDDGHEFVAALPVAAEIGTTSRLREA